MPNSLFKRTGLILLLIFTPKGAHKAENGTMQKTARKLIFPTKRRSAGIPGCSEKISVLIAPGKQIINPMDDAVPIALRAGTLKAVSNGTERVPPPIPSITEKNDTKTAIRLCPAIPGNDSLRGGAFALNSMFRLAVIIINPNKIVSQVPPYLADTRVPAITPAIKIGNQHFKIDNSILSFR